MTTALTNTNQQLPARTHLGDRNDIAAIRSRMASMMQLPADVPEDVVWAAAQLAVAYRLNPFIGEIYVMELGKAKDDVTGQWVKQFRAHIGIKGLRTLARRVANFTVDLTEMDAAEVKKFRGENYEPEDVGVRCTLWRLDTARECKDAGIPYKPNVAMGFWRKKAQYNKALSKWFEDNVPNTWVPYQVAEKRAEINAIRMAFDLNIDIGDPAVGDDEQTYTVMSQAIHDEDMAHALPATRSDVIVEDDGEIFYTKPDPPRNGKKQDAPPVQPDPARAGGQPDDIWEDAPADEPEDDHPWYAAVYDGLQNGVRVFADDMLRRHLDGDHASSVKAYGYLCDLVDTVIEAATGALDGHKRVFPVLCQRDVSADDMPSSKLVGSLLSQLATHIKDANGVKAENPDYNKMTEAAVVAVYRAAEGIGTIPLFGADA